MFKAVLMVVAAVAMCEAAVPPAGKCKDITPLPVPFNTVRVMYKYWKLLYLPDDNDFSIIDSEFREITSTSPNVIVANNKRKWKNNAEYPYRFVLTYSDDLIIYEETINENGDKSYFKWIPLAITSDIAILYYRCSDTNATLSIDTRFVVIPRGNKFTPADEQYLLDADKTFPFEGGIKKLDNKLQ